MPSPDAREAPHHSEAFAIPCGGNLALGNKPGHVMNVVTQESDVGQWMTLTDASNRYPVLRIIQGGEGGVSALCGDCSQELSVANTSPYQDA